VTSSYGPDDIARWAAEPPKRSGRTPFQRDRARVLHSSALRRLAAKTQVVRAGSADFPRTRLTHSLECAQIGRELGAALGCDPDLVDAACLAHDIGHPPFGHNGESALAGLASAGGPLECGGFEGNAQSLRLLTRLEPKVPGAGLNLTRASLDAALKYPWVGSSGKYGAYASDAAVFSWIRSGVPAGRRCLEAQVMDWADDVAYSVHDVEDGLHAGLVTLPALFSPSEQAVLAALALEAYCKPEWDASVPELSEVLGEFLAMPFWGFAYDGGFSALAAVKNLTSELVGRFCGAAERATLAEHFGSAASGVPASGVPASGVPASGVPASGVPASGVPATGVPASDGPASGDHASVGSAATRHSGSLARSALSGLSRYAADLVVPRRQLLECALLKAVAARYVMGREGAAVQQAGEREVIAELAMAIYEGAPATLDPVLRPAWDAADEAASATAEAERRRVVIDQVASLTDTSAIVWHRRLYS
jgi:dGTPase